ncbi:MAG: thioredoxin-disulfide reductase [Firmicutes bacterium]|nr:thioredoxin-disulfide reductase [Bacillota bacterium]MDY2818825.1 thioredoxin-disulfide reductase [Hominisplanchenecus sp.]
MDKVHDLVIVGSGPAGLSAAIYAQRARLDAVVLEKEYISGGQVVNTSEVDNYPGLPGMSGYELGMKLRAHADALEARFEMAEVKDIIIEETQNIVRTDQGDYTARAVIIATGARHRKLRVPGERELAGMGVSYCATCDGAFFKGRTVAVIGGGDVAVGDALFLARGCEKVYVIHRRDELRAARSMQEKLLALSNVEIIWDTVVEEICGEDQVEALRLKNQKTGDIRNLPIDGVFVAVGMDPNTDMVPASVDRDEKGYLVADENCVTNVKGIFAAGDVRTKTLRQIVTAAADGANAVESVQQYL